MQVAAPSCFWQEDLCRHPRVGSIASLFAWVHAVVSLCCSSTAKAVPAELRPTLVTVLYMLCWASCLLLQPAVCEQAMGIVCLESRRVAISGKVRAFALDKTGALTQAWLDFLAVQPVQAVPTTGAPHTGDQHPLIHKNCMRSQLRKCLFCQKHEA